MFVLKMFHVGVAAVVPIHHPFLVYENERPAAKTLETDHRSPSVVGKSSAITSLLG